MTTTAIQPRALATITVNEGNVAYLTGTLLDETGAPVPAMALSTLTLTLYDEKSDTVLNGRDAQSIFNANGGTYADESGAFTLTLGHLDNPLVSETLPAGAREEHIGLIEARWSGNNYWSGLVRVWVRAVHRNT